ncbi:MAG TPA: hypothetical protein VF123_11710 [Candidatus Sulfotelmatobacter sp.]
MRSNFWFRLWPLTLWVFLLNLPVFGQFSELWSGQAQCQVTVQSQGYIHQETQTWTLTGGAPTQQGAMQIYPATWSVTGQGSAQRPPLLAQWASNVSPMSAPLSIFVRASDNRLIIKTWHTQLVAVGGISAVRQIGATQSTTSSAAYEWTFPQIEADPTQQAVIGTGAINVPGNATAIPSASPSGTANCTWNFSKGAALQPNPAISMRTNATPMLTNQFVTNPAGAANAGAAAAPATAGAGGAAASAGVQGNSAAGAPTQTKFASTGPSAAGAAPAGDVLSSPTGAGLQFAGNPSGAAGGAAGSGAGSAPSSGAVAASAAAAPASSMAPAAGRASTHLSTGTAKPAISKSAVVQPPPPDLLPPANFAAKSMADGSVQLQWQSVTGASQYRLDGPGIPSSGLYVSGTGATNATAPRVVASLAPAGVPGASAVTRTVIQKVPLGPGTWHIASTDASGSWNPKLTASATAIVRYVPSHAGKWLSKNNGIGSSSQAMQHYLSLCPQCVPGASFTDVLTALGVSSDALADGNNSADDCFYTSVCTWTDLHAARYTNATEFGTTRVTRCWEALPGNNGLRTLCYSNSGNHGLTVIVKDSGSAWFLTFAWKDNAGTNLPNPAKEVVNWFGLQTLGVPLQSNYILTTQVTLDSEGPKYAPHACLSCHGGKLAGGWVSGATLLPLDTGLLRIDDRSPGMAANFAGVNQTVLMHGPSPAVSRYLNGLYGGPPVSNSWGDLDYVPQGWKAQSGFYKAAVRPYCMMCHLATPSNLDFSTYGNFAQNKDLINAEVCSGHTMPHAEYPFTQFWTKDTGPIFLPGYLAGALGITSCQ